MAESTSVNVFAHELGHSLGAKHDDLVSDCNPVGSDSYLMTGNSKVLKKSLLRTLPDSTHRMLDQEMAFQKLEWFRSPKMFDLNQKGAEISKIKEQKH